MNWTKMSAVAETLSSVAILVTLIYLAIQTQQNTDAIQAATRYETLIADLGYLSTFVGHPELDALQYKPDLTDAEKVRLSSHTLTFIRMRENSWLQYQNGILDEATWVSYCGSIVAVLAPPRMRSWWRRFVVDRKIMDPGFISMVNELIASQPSGDQSLHLMAID